MKDNIRAGLMFSAFVITLFGGAFMYAVSLSNDIQKRKELDSIRLINVKLEIELKKLELQKLNKPQ